MIKVLRLSKHFILVTLSIVTLGLPFLRTSVDHGTALALAGTGLAKESSLLKAIHSAIHYTTSKTLAVECL